MIIPNSKAACISGLGQWDNTRKLLNISSSIEIYTELYPPFRIDGYTPVTRSLPIGKRLKTLLKTW